ncbi:prefoldin subunit alpha [archaeon]|nr:prefoldin subunit alpha [archaeon]
MTENNSQEKYLEFQTLNQKLGQMNQELNLMEQQLMELKIIEESLINLKKVKPGTKTLSSVGPGIFAESRLDNNKEVLMNIGASVVVKKSILSAKTTISNKVEKINELMKQLQKEIESVNGNLQKLSRDLIESER